MDNLSEQNGFSLKKFLNPKLIFVILGAVLLLEVILAIRSLTAPLPASPKSAKQVAALTGGKISLSAPNRGFAVAEAVPVFVWIDTGGHVIAGADVIVHFDPKVLEASTAGLVKGKIFDEYPAMSVDVSKGLISISGVSSSKSGFAGIGQFAMINFKPKLPGKTSLTVDFKKDQTSDSNLVEATSSKDILENVTNLELIIQ